MYQFLRKFNVSLNGEPKGESGTRSVQI